MLPSNASQNLSSDAIANIELWLTQPKYAEYKDELLKMIRAERWHELEDAFFKVVEFGTAGRRGTTGLGSNRINKVTIGESAQALCEYVLSHDKAAASKGVAIAYDTRLTSPELSRLAAEVCAANGFKVYYFESFRSTPELSFAVRHLGAATGIVISASHNPPADNGFKAYWSDGGQIASPHDQGILDKAEAISDIKTGSFDEFVASGVIEIIGEAVDRAYIERVAAEAEGQARDISIVYSPLHGAGQTNTLPILRAAGFDDIKVVEPQMTPDGNFPTIPNGKPNPQEKAANDMAVEMLIGTAADIAITNDPDADRLGVMVRRGSDVVYLSGNQTYILGADYILSKLKSKGTLSPSHFLVNTIVTTDMSAALAKYYDVTCYNTLPVGFKYVGALITSKESTDEKFVYGGEESYGGLKGVYARDKDGASAALPLAEYAAELKLEGKTLWDKLTELYIQHGLYVEQLENIDSPGADGFTNMKRAMEILRTEPPRKIGDYEVTAILDYQSLERRDVATGEITVIDSIANNTVAVELGSYERRLTVRPSGTEPKMKFYGMWQEPASDLSAEAVAGRYTELQELLGDLSRKLAAQILS